MRSRSKVGGRSHWRVGTVAFAYGALFQPCGRGRQQGATGGEDVRKVKDSDLKENCILLNVGL